MFGWNQAKGARSSAGPPTRLETRSRRVRSGTLEASRTTGTGRLMSLPWCRSGAEQMMGMTKRRAFSFLFSFLLNYIDFICAIIVCLDL